MVKLQTTCLFDGSEAARLPYLLRSTRIKALAPSGEYFLDITSRLCSTGVTEVFEFSRVLSNPAPVNPIRRGVSSPFQVIFESLGDTRIKTKLLEIGKFYKQIYCSYVPFHSPTHWSFSQ